MSVITPFGLGLGLPFGGTSPSSPSGSGRFPATYLLPGLPPALAPDPVLVVFDNELANWLAGQLSVEVFPLVIPEGTTDYPVLVYSIVDGDSLYRAAGPDGLVWVRYQFDAYSPSYFDASMLNEQLRMALLQLIRAIRPGSGYTMGAATVRNATVHRPMTGYDPPGTGQENRGMYRRMNEVSIWFDQSLS